MFKTSIFLKYSSSGTTIFLCVNYHTMRLQTNLKQIILHLGSTLFLHGSFRSNRASSDILFYHPIFIEINCSRVKYSDVKSHFYCSDFKNLKSFRVLLGCGG